MHDQGSQKMQSGIREKVTVQGIPFIFSLCRKTDMMGSVPVDHWWMRTTPLYCQRVLQRSLNHRAVTEAFWALCRQGGTQNDPEVQESYLLSKVLPHARSQGSRRIFPDAYLEPRGQARQSSRQTSVADLDEMIRTSSRERLTFLGFQRKTGEALGPPELTIATAQAYQEFCQEFFGKTRAALTHAGPRGVAQAIAGWQQLMRSVGRRGGHALQKQVLDILSYEARAALHRCYSAVWDMLLLPHLQQKYALNRESQTFLRFWHLDQVSESNLGEVAYFHLFHGHIFALHPATGEFLRTAAGRALVGRWLLTKSKVDFGRLLHGLYVAVLHYEGCLQQVTSDRKKQPQAAGGPDLVDLEQQLLQRRSGRRQSHPHRGD
jgi:hypothetical protein